MDRRSFIKKTAFGAASLAVPTILPSGRLFAQTGTRRANHVVFCMFAGGVRNLESVFMNEGNLMPNMLKGTSSISTDISNSIVPTPSSPLTKTLQEYGTTFTNIKFKEGPPGHYNGHTSAITGQHTNENLSLRYNPPFPTVFEMYRKHNSPVHAAKNAWWISHNYGLYSMLNHSTHQDYGVKYAANQIAANAFFQSDISSSLRHELEFNSQKESVIRDLQAYLDSNFSSTYSLNSGVTNSTQDRQEIVAWLKGIQDKVVAGQLLNPWGMPYGMSADQYSLFFTEELLKTLKPELTVVNLFDVDVAHDNFSWYANALHQADYGVARLWNTIQSIPEMKDDTVMIVMPEIGRNEVANTLIDQNGRAALDHTGGDPMARDVFCMVVGPPNVVSQDKIDTTLGATVDVVPTIADILGFGSEIPLNLPGSVLQNAFI